MIQCEPGVPVLSSLPHSSLCPTTPSLLWRGSQQSLMVRIEKLCLSTIIIYSSRPVQNCPWIPATPHNLSLKFAPISHICVNNEIFNLPAQKICQFLGKMPKINVVSVFILHLDSLVMDIKIRVRMVAVLRRRWYNVTWYHDSGLLKRPRIFYDGEENRKGTWPKLYAEIRGGREQGLPGWEEGQEEKVWEDLSHSEL